MTKITRVNILPLNVKHNIRSCDKLDQNCQGLYFFNDSRKNEHCAVEKKAETISNLLQDSLKTNIVIIVSVVQFFCTGMATFKCAQVSLKSKPADSASGLAVSTLRVRQSVQKQSFFYISRDNLGPE